MISKTFLDNSDSATVLVLSHSWGSSVLSGECQSILEAVCPSEYDLEFSAIGSQLSSQHERGRLDCLGEKLEANLANIISTDEILEQLDVKHKSIRLDVQALEAP